MLTHISVIQGVDYNITFNLSFHPSRSPSSSLVQQAIQTLSPLPSARYHTLSRPPDRVIGFPLGEWTTSINTQLFKQGRVTTTSLVIGTAGRPPVLLSATTFVTFRNIDADKPVLLNLYQRSQLQRCLQRQTLARNWLRVYSTNRIGP